MSALSVCSWRPRLLEERRENEGSTREEDRGKGNAIYTAEIWKEGRSGDETEANENESSGEVCQQTQTWAARLNMENVTCFSSARGLLFGVAYVGVSVSCCVLALEVVHHLT